MTLEETVKNMDWLLENRKGLSSEALQNLDIFDITYLAGLFTGLKKEGLFDLLTQYREEKFNKIVSVIDDTGCNYETLAP